MPIDHVWTDPHHTLRDSCMPCPSYPNVMRLFAWRSEGIVDAGAIILLTTILAQRLCARIVLPHPCEMLSMPLMKQVELPVEVGWDDYYDARYRNTGESIFLRPPHSHGASGGPATVWMELGPGSVRVH